MIGPRSILTDKAKPAIRWDKFTPFSTTTLHSSFYYGGYWVVTGNGGTLAYATNPTGTWTAITSGLGTDNIYDCRYGNGYWVAVGANGKVSTCPTNPTGTWTLHSSPGFGTETLYGVCYGNGGWCVVGTNGILRTASDPTSTWTGGTSNFGSSLIFNVEYANSLWVIVGNYGKTATATDCTSTWTLADLGGQGWRGIGYGNGYWALTAYNTNGIKYSTNPTSGWSDNALGYKYESAFYGGGRWVLGPHDGNGQIVVRPTNPTSTFTNSDTTPASGISIYDVQFNGRTWLAIGTSGGFYVSR